MKEIFSISELKKAIEKKGKSYLLLFKKGSEKSDCAFQNISNAAKGLSKIDLLYADVNVTRDIHTEYGITSAPSLLEFDKSELKNVIKGCHNENYYKALFEDAIYFADIKTNEKAQKRVRVYSTPSCSWCTTLKSYLRQHKIRYTDIDVSVDQRAAEEMVRKSGQKGVPQTDINGEIIVGFNKARINELLEIQG